MDLLRDENASANSEFLLLPDSKWKNNDSFTGNAPLDTINWSSVEGAWPNSTHLLDSTASVPFIENATMPYYLYVYVTTPIFYAIVFLFGVVGNVLVIYVVLKNSDMLTATNLFLMNLSIADLLVLLICMPSSLTEFLAKEVWLLGAVMCKYHINILPFSIKLSDCSRWLASESYSDCYKAWSTFTWHAITDLT